MQPAASLPVTGPGGRQHPGKSEVDEFVVVCPCRNVESGTSCGVLSGKCIFIGGAIIILILSIAVIGLAIALGVHYSGEPRCPYDWIGYRGKCYYVSEKEDNWTSSQSFCSAHGAFLAILEDEEKIFVNRITDNRPSWIGLYRERGLLWKWLNGENPLLEVIGEGGDCAYLNDEGKPSSSRCSTEHHWICTKAVV